MSSRFEHEDQARLDRARAHLARVRDRRAHGRVVWRRRARPERNPSRPASRIELCLVAAVATAAGVLLGEGWLLAARDLVGEPAALTRIAVDGAKRLSARAVANATGIAPGTPLSELDEASIEERLAAHEWIREARVRRLPGGSLVIRVAERVPVATTLAGEPARAFAVDASGTVFAPLDTTDEALLRLVPREPLSPGAPDPRLARAIELATELDAAGLGAPRAIGIGGDAHGFTLLLAGLDTEFVLGHEDLPERLDRLSRLLALRPDEVASAARVDLRFEDQVVLSKGAARDESLHKAASRGVAAPRGTRQAG